MPRQGKESTSNKELLTSLGRTVEGLLPLAKKRAEFRILMSPVCWNLPKCPHSNVQDPILYQCTHVKRRHSEAGNYIYIGIQLLIGYGSGFGFQKSWPCSHSRWFLLGQMKIFTFFYTKLWLGI